MAGEHDSDDSDLIPLHVAQPAADQRPRDPATGQFLPLQPTVPEPAQHDPYMLARARQYGLPVDGLTPQALGAVLTAFDTQQAAAASRAAPATPPVQTTVQEPAVDWGEDDDGKPLTEEQAKKAYPRAVFNAIKASHDLPKLRKQNEALQQSIEQDRQERHSRAAERRLDRVLASRPDLFGEKPDEIAPNSIEAHRRQAVVNHLNSLLAAKKQTTLEQDAAAALAMFGPAPERPTAGKKPVAPRNGAPSPVDLAAAYRRAETARPGGRHSAEPFDRRAALIELEKARQAEENGSTVAIGGDDDDDLPPPRG